MKLILFKWLMKTVFFMLYSNADTEGETALAMWPALPALKYSSCADKSGHTYFYI